MGRTLLFMLALTLAAPAILLPVAGRASNRSQPMHFNVYREGSPEGCSDKCKIVISAFGTITADTPQEFHNFAQSRDLTGATVVLDSDGGSVHGALALGREIRQLALNTTVGRIADVTKHAGVFYVTVLPRGDCESMCAFVLLAGVHRVVPDEAQVMVHQIWLGDRREDPTAGSYSAEDLVLVQRDIGKLAQYTAEMGVSIDLLDLSLRIPPWEPMHALSREELHRMQVATQVATDEPNLVRGLKVTEQSPAPSPPMQLISDKSSVTEISERRWALIDQFGAAVLARRHPLTIEGKDVGNFDLLFSCSSETDSYDVTYIERRHDGENMPRPKPPLHTVALRLGSHQAILKVVSSVHHEDADELATYARGPIPAELIDGFSADGDHSLIIETKSARLMTSIRIGNTGVQRNMPQLASTCAKPLNARAELNVAKTGSVALAK